MLRHIGGKKRSPSPEQRAHSPGDYRGDRGDSSVLTDSTTNSVFYKKSSLSRKQRNDLRGAMLGFLESTRDEETQLVRDQIVQLPYYVTRIVIRRKILSVH